MIGFLLALVLTEEDAVRMALEGPMAKMAETETAAAEEALGEAKSPFWPQLSFSAGYTYLSYVPEISMVVPDFSVYPPTYDTMTIQMGQHNNYQLTLRLSQALLTWGRLLHAKRTAQLQLEAKRAQESATEIQLAGAARAAFWSAVMAWEMVRLEEEQVAKLRSHYEDTKRRYASGTASKFELLRAELELKTEEPNLVAARKSYEDALGNLRALLGIPEGEEITLSYDTAVAVPEINQDSALALVDQRPDIKALELGARALSEAALARAAADKPQVFGFLQYDYMRPYGFEDEWGDRTTLGLSLSWNIFDGFGTRHAATKLKLQAKAQEYLLSSQKRKAKEDVLSAIRGIREAKERLAKAEETLKLAKDVLAMAENQYRSGLITQLELMDARRALNMAEIGYLLAKWGLRLALVQLDVATGKIPEVRK